MASEGLAIGRRTARGAHGHRPLAQQLPVGFSGLSGPDSSPLYIGTGRPASGAASQAASCLSSFATGIRSVHGNGNGSQNVVFFSPRVYGRGAVERQPRSPPWLMFERHHAKRWRNVVAGVRATGGGGRAVGAHQMTTRTEETVNWLLITRENVKTWGARSAVARGCDALVFDGGYADQRSPLASSR